MILNNWKQTLAVLFAVLMMTTPAVAVGGGASASTPGQVSAFDLSDFGVPDTPDDVIRYGADANPGIMVTVSESEDLDALEEWANASDDRVIVERFESTNTVLLAFPAADLDTGFSPSGWLSSARTLSELSYVDSWTWDTRVQSVDPITNLENSSTFEKPRAAWWAELTTSGEYSASAMAWDSDAEAGNLSDAARSVGADEVSATGEGVNVAVIDSGVNFGNGTLFGNGTEGSDMRVTDAYDFVEGQSVNLSVNRSELPAELEAVEDPNGHGSWVASAVLNARDGIAPDANLMAYRALNSEGSGSTSDIRNAISRANQNGADIIVMSLGSPMYSEGMADELEHALSEDGNVTGVFIAAGNSFTTTRYLASPADVDGVVAVSATQITNASAAKKASFANTGPDAGLDGSPSAVTREETPDTAAPGMKITAPVWTEPSASGGVIREHELSGTSMAAPIAAGVGALVLDADPDLTGNPDEFRELVVNSGSHTPNIGVTESRGGMINATRAINGYDSADAPDRELSTETAARDDANRILIGDVGTKLISLSDTFGGLV